MPPVPVPNDNYFLGTIQDLRFRMAALETQQQSVISNLQGEPVLATGLSPGSNPAQWGIQLLSQAFGSEVSFYGEDAAGLSCLRFRNSAGDVVVQIDVNGVHLYNTSGTEIVTLNANGLTAGGVTVNASGLTAGGVTVNSSGLTAGPVTLTSAGLAAGGGVEVNASGLEVYNGATLEVQAGQISSSPSIYGLAVRPYGGSLLQQVGGTISVSGLSAINVTNTTWANFTGTSSVTAEIGPSGEVTISAGGHIGTGSAGQHGYIGVSIDGGTAVSYADIGSGGGATAGTVGLTNTVSGLTAGSHTFQLQYECSGGSGTTCSFDPASISVQPL